MLNIDSITSTSNSSVVSQEQLFTELTPEQGAMIEGGEFTVLIRDVGPAKAAIPTQQGFARYAALTANPTVLQITNSTGYNLFYDLAYDAPNAGNNLSIAPGQVSNFLGLNPIATASWDLDLLAPGVQNRTQDLAPGRRYEFYEV
ncbi:MAG: hypothetical protein RM049_29585 [Nostoc sp. DedQUE04]|uniref:hypothetical protein n=1 Tax=Nostoc sp. DedQUE04 TaxID=3075390 RepID=UPI002AD58DB1|nr:hypothetical protein [Nostoc sp. DedQUE04]MDZ8139391.1 hypothetical protein [Nostoc sp. DedQUE04]